MCALHMAIFLPLRLLTMNNPVSAGASLKYQGVPFVIRSMRADLKDVVLVGKGGVERTLDFNDFYNQIASGEIVFPDYEVSRAIKSWLPSEYAEGVFRSNLLKLIYSHAYEAASESEKKEKLVDFCGKNNKSVPSEKTIRSYKKKYARGGFEALIPNYSGRGGNGWSKKKDAKEIAFEVILESFSKDDKVSVTSLEKTVSQILKEKSKETGVSLELDRKTLARMIFEMPRDLAFAGRMSPRTYRSWVRQAVKEFYVDYAFELVQIDAKTIEMYVVDDFGTRYTEITLYAMICSRTGYPVAIYVTPGKPSEYTLLKLFEFFFLPKDKAFKERFGLETDWVPPCGLSTALLDNASENTGGVSLEIIRDLGIDWHLARAYRGDDKPYVESFFKMLNELLLHRMPGATKSAEKAVKNRHERAEKEACYSVEQVYKEIVKFVGDVYIHIPRVKLGFRYGAKTSIKEAMDEELSRFMPPPPPSIDRIKRLVLQRNRATCKVQHYGIDFSRFRYNSYEFAALVKERQITDIEILFNPGDCLVVYAVNPFDGSLIKLNNKMKDVPAVSFETAKILRKEYGGDYKGMVGHDYQRIYAGMLAKYSKDSGRRPNKIKQNNKNMREQERNAQARDVSEQLEKHAIQPLYEEAISVEHDDDFIPAPREDLSCDKNR